MELVVLLHGLGRTAGSMRPLARDLRRAGFSPRAIGYPSHRLSLDDAAQRVGEAIAPDVAAATRVHLVGHSLGALVARTLLRPPTAPAPATGAPSALASKLGRLVLIAAPNRGSRMAERVVGRSALLRWLYGPVARELCDSDRLAALGAPPCPFAVIAGTRAFSAINPLTWVGRAVLGHSGHDGTVAVAEATLEGAADSFLVDCGHTFIPSHPKVRRQVIAFLRDGRFDRAAAQSPAAM